LDLLITLMRRSGEHYTQSGTAKTVHESGLFFAFVLKNVGHVYATIPLGIRQSQEA